jgi:hypothetical protein
VSQWQGCSAHSLDKKENITMLKFIGAVLSGIVTMTAASTWIRSGRNRGSD